MKKKDFPIFTNQPDLIYFDSAATTQRPYKVLDAMNEYYTHYNANPGRAVYQLAERATRSCDEVRSKVTQFIGAQLTEEIVFTRGATEGINFIGRAWADHNLKEGDEVVVTELEHHANFVPWYQMCKRKNAVLRVIPVSKNGQLVYNNVSQLFTSRTKLLAITQMSNVLGVSNSKIESLISAARKVGARVLVDGSQVAKYQPIDVQSLGCDFYVFSGHKMYGPTGVGVLYINKKLHKEVEPYQFGGGAVLHVSADHVEYPQPPACYEAGTKPVAEIIGLGAAIDYIGEIGFSVLQNHTHELVSKLLDGLQCYSRVRVLGDVVQLRNNGTLVSFTIDGIHSHDAAAFFDTKGICVRAGHHCAQPLAQAMGYDASLRVSFGIYNEVTEVTYFLQCLEELLTGGIF